MTDRLKTISLIFFITVFSAVEVISYYSRNFALFLASLAMLSALATVSISKTRTIFLTITSTLLSLLAAELVLSQIANPSVVKTTAANYGAKNASGGPGNPGVHSSKEIAPDGTLIYDVKYTIDRTGYRLTPENRDTAARINFFGCSVTYGEGLNDDETLPYFVLKDLENVSVKNWAFHGYGVHHALDILQGDKDTSGYVNILITGPWHAGRSACVYRWNTGSPRYRLTSRNKVERDGVCPHPDWLPTTLRLLGHSKIYKLIADSVSSAGRRINNGDIDLYLALIEEFGRLSKRRGQRFVIGFIKADEKYVQETSYSNKLVFEKMKRNADAIVDITLADSSGTIPSKYRLHELDGHPTKLANRERAKLLVDALKRL